jgi:hypothetical protein
VPINPKTDKVARAHSVQPTFSQHLVFAPNRDWAEMVKDEMAKFPKFKFKDLTDSATQAHRGGPPRGLLRVITHSVVVVAPVRVITFPDV